MLIIILGLLFLLGMFYVKRRLDGYDKRLELLTETIQTMAGIRMEEIDKEEEEDEEEDEDEEDVEEEDEEEDKEEKRDPDHRLEWLSMANPPRYQEPKEENEIWKASEEPIQLVPRDAPINSIDIEGLPDVDLTSEIKMIQLPRTTVSDDNVTEFDGLSLKELKEKVAELNGPKLKTKKECIDFLKLKSTNEL
jgi:hypothetical protein